MPSPASDQPESASRTLVDQAGRQLRAPPWAASIAGLLFAGLFTAALVIIRTHPMLGATDLQLARMFATGDDVSLVIAGLYLTPIAGIAFLWFVAVIRDQIGEREDRFFATVFLASGIIFVSVLFVSDAVAMAPSWRFATWANLHPQRP